MKKLGRQPQKLETLNLFSLLQSGDGNTLYDPANRQSFLSQVDSGLTRALDSEATLHGIGGNLGTVKLPIPVDFPGDPKCIKKSQTSLVGHLNR